MLKTYVFVSSTHTCVGKSAELRVDNHDKLKIGHVNFLHVYHQNSCVPSSKTLLNVQCTTQINKAQNNKCNILIAMDGIIKVHLWWNLVPNKKKYCGFDQRW